MYSVAALAALALSGCASYPAATQPRALGLGTLQPYCLFLCFQTNTMSDAETGSKQQATTNSTQSATVTP